MMQACRIRRMRMLCHTLTSNSAFSPIPFSLCDGSPRLCSMVVTRCLALHSSCRASLMLMMLHDNPGIVIYAVIEKPRKCE